jgi:C_GCAxxG_C_C family probable redox protein
MSAPAESEHNARKLAKALFLRDDNHFGCAEATLVALQEIYQLPDATDSSAAMALNGGVAYGGGICGAISGAAMAVGRLAEQRMGDHQRAKRTARRLIQELMSEFEHEFGSHNCSDLIDYEISIPSQHDAFIAGNVWRDTCMRQIEFSVTRLFELADEEVWDRAVARLGT